MTGMAMALVGVMILALWAHDRISSLEAKRREDREFMDEWMRKCAHWRGVKL